ncbi:hypothetical protein HF521_018963 [Silurus meridionalis]|uniref:A-kinase anchor protein 13 n=1 Tax=Silurus meridionalis TaxID=175797 RepID=A0A8T0BLC5_SILME|nr:hypothetical protein HF521_018963 [Silurus meridionalis]
MQHQEPAEGLVLDVPLVAEEHIRETQMDHQTLFPETEECFLPGSESDIQHETSQMPTKEPSQEHCEPQPDIKHFPIMDPMDQIGDPGSSYQSLLFALDQRSKVSPDLMSEEAGCGLESKLEREPVAFQTPPESPCEYFSVDGFIKMNDSIEELFPASVELSHAAGSRATMEVGEKVETEMPELCEISKKSPVMILCGSFSKLTIRGSPPNLHLDSTTSENIEREAVSAGDSEASTTHSTEIEMEETKEEVMKLEPEFVEKCERSEPSQISAEGPPCNSVFKIENLEGTAVIEHDQPPEYSDVQEKLLKVPSQLGENPEIASLPCEPLSPSISVSKNITELHSEVINQTFGDLQPELVTSTETVVETPHIPHLEVNKFKEDTIEQFEGMTSEESISGTPDVPHELIASSGETTVETSPDPLPEAKTSEKSTQDQQPKISEDSSRETSLDLPHDLITSSVDTSGKASHVPHPDINRHEESNHFKHLDESRNDLHDLKHEVTSFQESIRGTPEFNHDLITTSEEAIGETSCEGNRSQENVLDKQAESMSCETRKNETSQDPNFEVTTSECDLEGPNYELITCGEMALEEQLEVTSCEESIGQTPHHTQCEEKACEENLRTTLDFMSTEVERCLAEAPVHTETTSLDAPVSGDDSGLDLENVPTPGLVQISDLDQPVDLDSGNGLDMDVCSSVEVNSGLIQDVPPLENVICESGALDEEKHQAKKEEEVEEPKEEQIAGDVEQSGVETKRTPQSDQIHREEEEEVLYSISSEYLKQDCSKENKQTDVTDVAVASVCRSVSATSLPGSESVSDGDSLLGQDTTDDTVFKQSEDTLTLTSGISMTGSISTDDSSITHTAGETEEEEKKDRLMEVLERSSVLRSTSRSLSPSRRHSWGPSKNQIGEMNMGQRSVLQVEGGGKPAGHRRSMSWCPSHVPHPEMEEMNSRSYSLEGLAANDEVKMPSIRPSTHLSMTEREERGSLASLTEEENESNMGDNGSLDNQRTVQDAGVFVPPHQTLTKSISMSAISPKDLDDVPVSSAAAGSQEFSISEEDPAPLRSDSEVKVTKVSRTFSYLKNKMSKKSKDKDREKIKDVKEKKIFNGHLFNSSLTPPLSPCLQCNRPISMKDALTCTNCNVHIHKSCRDALPLCAKANIKQQTVTDSALPPGILSRGKSASARERPWSTFLLPDDQVSLPAPLPPRKNSSIMSFNSGSLSKSISISNIAGQLDEAPLKALKILSQSTDSLNKLGKVNESTESLTDEGTELMDSHLMVEFEAEVKELEADSWSFTMDKKYLKQLKKDIIKRQDVIYELIQTEMHHVRTLRIMSEVYSKGLQKEVQVDVETLEKMFPVLEELMELHTHFLTHLLERRRESREEETARDGGFVIRRIGDVLLDQVTIILLLKVLTLNNYHRVC